MSDFVTRRDVLKTGATAAALAALSGFDRIAALAPDEEVIPWTDIPANFSAQHSLDTRTFQRSSFITANDDFYLVQHYGIQQVDPSTYRLRVTGLVDKPLELTLDEIKRRPRVEQIVGFECGGNSPANLNRLAGNARWGGTRLRDLLTDVQPQTNGREIVFFGFDKGMETVAHGRGGPQDVEQHFGRSLTREDAMRPEVMLAWEMNGAPLPPEHGAPLRLVVPGWYGVANVKWMNHIHVQDSRFQGRFMSRDYVTLRPEKLGDETIWNESVVQRIRVKSMVARLTRSGSRYTAVGFALAGALPLKSIDVRVDDGPWRRATFDTQNTEYSWKLFSYSWDGLSAGDHTIVSRAVDANGVVQPEQVEVDQKRTMWENNGRFVRKFHV